MDTGGGGEVQPYRVPKKKTAIEKICQTKGGSQGPHNRGKRKETLKMGTGQNGCKEGSMIKEVEGGVWGIKGKGSQEFPLISPGLSGWEEGRLLRA